MDRMKYINHRNEVVEFGAGNILIAANDIRDGAWDYSTLYKRVVSFSKKVKTSKLPVLIYGDNAKETEDRIHDIIEADIDAVTPGRLYIGDYYCRGYFEKTTYKKYTREGILKLELQFLTDEPIWTKTTSYHFRIKDEINQGRGYAYGYPYDFISGVNIQSLYNKTGKSQDMNVVIYGPCVNPYMTIGGHVYSLECELFSDEYLTLDTKQKTIVKTTRQGEKINLFSKRNKDSYIFEKIKPGQNAVTMTPESNFDITLLEERSEPKWT